MTGENEEKYGKLSANDKEMMNVGGSHDQVEGSVDQQEVDLDSALKGLNQEEKGQVVQSCFRPEEINTFGAWWAQDTSTAGEIEKSKISWLV